MIDIVLPKTQVVTTSENYGCYQIEPLEPGFGITIGNAMRRVLLSALPGAAITSLKIDNVYHEFSGIPHVSEDVIEIIMNIKQLRLRCFSDHPVQLFLEATGAGKVTAADLICPPEVEIVNPELHIATLDSDEARLHMELTAERGRGYVPADDRSGSEIGVIPVDAIYTPVKKANFKVERRRVGQITDYDRLILEVWTDGTIAPDEAIAQAAQILIKNLTVLEELGAKPITRLEKPLLRPASIPPKVYDIPIEDLDLSIRAHNCLKRAGITKVGQVLEMTKEDLLHVRNFGHKSYEELRDRLAVRGLLDGSRLAASALAEVPKEEMAEEEAVPPTTTQEEAIIAPEEIPEAVAMTEEYVPEAEEEEYPLVYEEEEEEGKHRGRRARRKELRK